MHRARVPPQANVLFCSRKAALDSVFFEPGGMIRRSVGGRGWRRYAGRGSGNVEAAVSSGGGDNQAVRWLGGCWVSGGGM